MSAFSSKQIKQILGEIPLAAPEQFCSNALKNITINSNQIQVDLELGYPIPDYYKLELKDQILAKLREHVADKELKLEIKVKVSAHAPQPGVKGLASIKNIIGVASGKGGVGKSTTSINLALALARAGAKVGLLDADIYGPNQPQMLGIRKRPEITEDKKLHPIERFGIKTMSMGYLVAQETPMVWRGPMVSSALSQLMNDTLWGELDYLIIDLPPGTGDIQLTLAKKIPVSAAVIVTTPQDVALLDAAKAVAMFNKTKVPVLGVIENMSTHICSECGHVEAIFGEAGGQRMADEFKLPLLGQMPLNIAIRKASDEGTPIIESEPNSDLARLYQDLALKVAAYLSVRPKGYSHLFSNVIIEKET